MPAYNLRGREVPDRPPTRVQAGRSSAQRPCGARSPVLALPGVISHHGWHAAVQSHSEDLQIVT